MTLLEVRFKLIDSESDRLGLSNDIGEYAYGFIIAEQVVAMYPNNDEDTGEPITTIDMIGGQTHHIYERFESLYDRYKYAINPTVVHNERA